MPSGISHMLISRNLPIDNESSYRFERLSNIRYFQLGSIAPDLPYGAIADNNFFKTKAKIADLFHFTDGNQSIERSPNKLPLLGMRQVKNMLEQSPNKKQCDAFFWFLAGYASHVIADGLCHPFVMDKVGRYEGQQNKAMHCALEIGIDVFLFKQFTSAGGYSIEASYAGMDSLIASFNDLNHTEFILKHFTNLINTIYELPVSIAKVRGWIKGISRLFSISTGKWPDWFKQLDATTSLIFRQIADIEGQEEKYLVLKKPKFWDNNFLNVDTIHFINDCISRFNKLMKLYLNKAYAYVYEGGHDLIEKDLPAFSLDTGRTVNDPNNIALTPILWEEAA